MTHSLDKTSAKILVLGDSGVGKSSLVHLICHSQVLNSAQCTIGCSIDVKLHCNSFLEFWDIGGSRGHKIARSFLYQDFHGIVLVFDSTNKKSRLNLNEWLLEAGQRNSDKDLEAQVCLNVPLLTIGTRKDLAPPETVLDHTDNYNCTTISGSSSSGGSCNSSVVNINHTSPRTTNISYPHSRRKQLQQALDVSSSSSISSFASFHSAQSASEHLLAGQRVLFVNNQDVLSFSPGTRNHETLNQFLKNVIDGRNKRFYNKFAI